MYNKRIDTKKIGNGKTNMYATPKQKRFIKALMNELRYGEKDMNALIKKYSNTDSIHSITTKDASRIISMLLDRKNHR